MMKRLLPIAGAAILLVAAPFVLWHLMDDPLERRVAPLLGEWRSTRDGRIRISFRIDEQQGCIAIRRPEARRTTVHALGYDTCLHFTDRDGRRVDIFYTPSADALLLVPGGAFRRTNPKTE